jgi:hypothetical protein
MLLGCPLRYCTIWWVAFLRLEKRQNMKRDASGERDIHNEQSENGIRKLLEDERVGRDQELSDSLRLDYCCQLIDA